MSGAPIVLGWREWVALPTLGLERIEAKIDTGARTSTLHAVEIELFQRHGGDWIRFVAAHEPDEIGIARWVEAPVRDRRAVKSSTGWAQQRYVIATELVLAGTRTTIELTLADRTRMRYPMLVGRTALAGRFVVDPARTHLLGG